VIQQLRLQYLVIYGFSWIYFNGMLHTNEQIDLLGYSDIFTGEIDSIVEIANN
jgi:hypothetical protein